VAKEQFHGGTSDCFWIQIFGIEYNLAALGRTSKVFVISFHRNEKFALSSSVAVEGAAASSSKAVARTARVVPKPAQR